MCPRLDAQHMQMFVDRGFCEFLMPLNDEHAFRSKEFEIRACIIKVSS